MKTKTLLDPASWEKVYDLDELGLDLTGQRVSVLTNASLEGPELFQLNKKDWTDPEKPEYVLMADQYKAGAVVCKTIYIGNNRFNCTVQERQSVIKRPDKNANKGICTRYINLYCVIRTVLCQI